MNGSGSRGSYHRPMQLRHLAVIAYHSSPLAEPGAGDAGGMTVYVRELARALARNEVNVDIFTRSNGTTRSTVELADGVQVVSLEAGPSRSLTKEEMLAHIDDFSTGLRAYATAHRRHYGVIHAHYWQSGLAARPLAAAWDVPLVQSPHTLARVKNNALAPGDLPEPLSRVDGEMHVLAAADVIVASTDEEYEQLACLYRVSHDRLKTVPPGVDHQLFRPGGLSAARAELGLAADDVVLVQVGRIQPLKGLPLAIATAEQLRRVFGDRLRLVLVGGASGTSGEEELLRTRMQVREAGLEQNVSFVGPQPHSRLPLFYRAADVAIVCSHSESFGLAALEASACATPVVGTAVGGLSHVVSDGESGFLVFDRDPVIFAERVKVLLLDADLRRRFGEEAHRRAVTYSWDRTATMLLELYDCLVSERFPEACTC